MSHTKHLRQLLQTDNLAQFLTEMLEATEQNGQKDLHSDITLQSAAYHGNERQKRSNIISDSFYAQTRAKIRYALESLLGEYKDNGKYIFDNESLGENKSAVTGDGNIVIQGVNNSNITIHKPETQKIEHHSDKPIKHKPKVFISYNHGDKATALKVKAYLEKQGLQVTIDVENLHAGDDIKTFIEKSIKENDVTLSIVSEKSLMSTWVSMETVNTFYAQKYTDKKFIAAFIEGSFFKRSFVRETTTKIKSEITEIRDEIQACLESNLSILHLQNELRRYEDLEHHLPAIVQRLKESLSVDISGENFEGGMKQIVLMEEVMVVTESIQSPLELEQTTERVIFSQDDDEIYKPEIKMTNNTLLFEHGYALFIGIRYANPDWNGIGLLNGTLRDVNDLYNHFTNTTKAAYKPENIILLTEKQATRQGIIDALDKLIAKANADNKATVIVYYSGHGETDGTNYFLVPYDFNLAKWRNNKTFDADKVVLSKEFAEKIAIIQASKCMVILDCCHAENMPIEERGLDISSNFIKGFAEGVEKIAIEKGLTDDIQKGRGRVILTSCEAGEKSLDLGTNGLFTQVLLECLNGADSKPDGWVRLTDMMDYIPLTVKNRAAQKGRKQSPMFKRIENLGAEPFFVCAYDIGKAKGLDDATIETLNLSYTTGQKIEETKQKLSSTSEMKRKLYLTQYNFEKTKFDNLMEELEILQKDINLEMDNVRKKQYQKRIQDKNSQLEEILSKITELEAKI